MRKYRGESELKSIY